MISPETRVQIRRYFYAEHWKIGTIAQALDVHPDTVRRAIEVERFPARRAAAAVSLSIPIMPFVRQTLEQHPRLARHAPLPDDPGPRLYRQRRSSCGAWWRSLRPQSREAIPALAGLSGRAGAGGLGYFGP